MSETTVTVIEKVEFKEGTRANGKPWKKYAAVTPDGFYSTFDKSIAKQAQDLIGERVEIFWKPSGGENQFKDLLTVKAATNGAPAVADGIPTAQNKDGTANWDIVGLRKTRCLLWAHFLNSPLAAAVAQATDSGQVPSADAVWRFGMKLVALAESDVYWREPAAADEGIPFMPTIDGLGN